MKLRCNELLNKVFDIKLCFAPVALFWLDLQQRVKNRIRKITLQSVNC